MANPLVTGDWPTKRPVTRAENVPADSSWVSEYAAGMSSKYIFKAKEQNRKDVMILGEMDQS